MSVPINQSDYERFKKLAEAIMQSGIGEVSIYTSSDKTPKGCYVAIEMRSSSVDSKLLEDAFKCAPLPERPEPIKNNSMYD